MIRDHLKDTLILAPHTLDGEARKEFLNFFVRPHEVIDGPAAAHHQTYRNNLIDRPILGRGDLMALRRGKIPVEIPLDRLVIEYASVTLKAGESVSVLIVGAEPIAIDVALALTANSAASVSTWDERSPRPFRTLGLVDVPFEMMPTEGTCCDDWCWHIRLSLPRSVE